LLATKILTVEPEITTWLVSPTNTLTVVVV
jgi:hypothetical protein